jgi:hypothetical protein
LALRRRRNPRRETDPGTYVILAKRLVIGEENVQTRVRKVREENLRPMVLVFI